MTWQHHWFHASQMSRKDHWCLPCSPWSTVIQEWSKHQAHLTVSFGPVRSRSMIPTHMPEMTGILKNIEDIVHFGRSIFLAIQVLWPPGPAHSDKAQVTTVKQLHMWFGLSPRICLIKYHLQVAKMKACICQSSVEGWKDIWKGCPSPVLRAG